MTSGLYTAKQGSDSKRTIEIHCGENHSLTLEAHHLAWGKIGNEQHVFSHEFLGIPMLGDTAEDSAVFTCSVVEDELE